MPRGRPKAYTIKIAKEICEKTAVSSKSLKTIAKEVGFAPRTILDWLNEYPDFAQMYARAKEEQADFLAEELLEISDDSSRDLERIDEYGNRIENKEFVNRSRLRVDARKWIAAKLKPKKYGEKLDLNHEGSISITWNEQKNYAADDKTD